MFIDTDGREIVGVTKDDAKKAKDGAHKVFADKRFDFFRALNDIKGKKLTQ
ncbi:hypothetical protein [Chryseobacterium piscicola]|uniref:hypothetical protein n=1 Tax=Chryseobacterium piscicola TaxID=551459 RepID=UPI0013565915|nr:hypothetical protein [Chryseobacterium piscicola]